MSTISTTKCDYCGYCFMQHFGQGYRLYKTGTICYLSYPPKDNGADLDFCNLRCLYRWLENTDVGLACREENLKNLEEDMKGLVK